MQESFLDTVSHKKQNFFLLFAEGMCLDYSHNLWALAKISCGYLDINSYKGTPI